MTKVLVVYDSRTGNTERMAMAVADGARQVKGTEVVVLSVDKAKMQDLVISDAIILGSPTYYGNMSGKMKSFIDQTYRIHGRLRGKVGGAFTSSGDTACGAETTVLSMLEAMLIHGMIIQGRYDNKHYGPTAVEAPNTKEIGSCKELGKRMANLAAALGT
ncbi:MAG: NAD(P)H-dependent oxidoreductase [Thermoplasmatota archaeon]|nr:NAD(P)H-dependent oxidoreductase [Candidatus Thermoplasmatota archaeon]MBU1913954.1 NAD(P)H-dependent oxidoreductase [Candidatus Thermoplasmatota archaeon]